MMGMGGDHASTHLRLVNEQLKQERDILQKKVDDLQGIISDKNKEINELRKNGGSGSGNEAIENLARNNERLMQELTKMQEQMRKMESFNQSYVSAPYDNDRYGL